MKLYDFGLAPNPRRVRIYLAEKGIRVPTEQVDLGTMQQRSAAFTAINPLQQVPALVLHDGTVIAESIAICRYFEALNPHPRCSGSVRWSRRWWRCGTAVSNRTCSFRCPRSFVIRIPP